MLGPIRVLQNEGPLSRLALLMYRGEGQHCPSPPGTLRRQRGCGLLQGQRRTLGQRGVDLLHHVQGSFLQLRDFSDRPIK